MKKISVLLLGVLVLTACSNTDNAPHSTLTAVGGDWSGVINFDTPKPDQPGLSRSAEVKLMLEQSNKPQDGDFRGLSRLAGDDILEQVNGNRVSGKLMVMRNGFAINCAGQFNAQGTHYEGSCTSESGAKSLKMDKK